MLLVAIATPLEPVTAAFADVRTTLGKVTRAVAKVMARRSILSIFLLGSTVPTGVTVLLAARPAEAAATGGHGVPVVVIQCFEVRASKNSKNSD
jgi:hypothetical protein